MKKIIKSFWALPAWVYATGVAAVALVARSLFLIKSSVWHDEGYTAMIINLPPPDIVSVTINDVHPPLYYLLLHFWQELFGGSVMSLRGFSVICGLATVVLLYFLLRKISSEGVARLGAFLAAIGPFLVRYSEEMRMYSLAALIAVATTYVFILAIQSKNRWAWWVLYGALLAAGLYTQYFLALLVPAHLIYMWLQNGDRKSLKNIVRHKGLWIGAISGIVLFLPWLPVMIGQVTRVSSGFWIPPIDWRTIPNTLSMFMTYDDRLTQWLGVTFLLGIVIAAVYLARRIAEQKATIGLLLAWTILPMIVVALISLKNPLYIDRYFAYSAPAFYALLAVLICAPSKKMVPFWQKLGLFSVVTTLMFSGLMVVGNMATHQMEQAANMVNSQFQEGDDIVSAELYTYFDFSFYNQTGRSAKLLSEEPFGRYGEWGLARATGTQRVAKLSDVQSSRVWIVGKTGDHDYFTSEIPRSWQLISQFSSGDSVVKLYRTTPQI